MKALGPGPVAQWLSSQALLQLPWVSPVWIPLRTWHLSSGHAEAASHIAKPEGPITRICNYVLGGVGEKKGKKKRKIGNRC